MKIWVFVGYLTTKTKTLNTLDHHRERNIFFNPLTKTKIRLLIHRQRYKNMQLLNNLSIKERHLSFVTEVFFCCAARSEFFGNFTLLWPNLPFKLNLYRASEPQKHPVGKRSVFTMIFFALMTHNRQFYVIAEFSLAEAVKSAILVVTAHQMWVHIPFAVPASSSHSLKEHKMLQNEWILKFYTTNNMSCSSPTKLLLLPKCMSDKSCGSPQKVDKDVAGFGWGKAGGSKSTILPHFWISRIKKQYMSLVFNSLPDFATRM